MVRPSYVLGGRGMEIVYDDAQLRKYVDRACSLGKLMDLRSDLACAERNPKTKQAPRPRQCNLG